MRVAFYTRVSTTDQHCENQLQQLQEVASRQGWLITRVYTDNGISGAKDRDRRPGFRQLMQDAARRRFDLVAVAALDRLGRSVAAVSTALAELDALGIKFLSLREGMDTGTPTGRAMLSMAIVFSELERELIVERTRAGLARARAAGVRFGRPKLPEAKERAIRQDFKDGLSLYRIARKHGTGHSVLQRIRRELEAERAGAAA